MSTCKIFVLLLIPLFLLPLQSWGEEQEPLQDSGRFIMSHPADYDMDRLQDERILALEAKFSADLQAMKEAIQEEQDPVMREDLQKQAETLKEGQEMEMKKLLLEIAMERGDESRIAEFEAAIESLENPRVAQVDLSGPRQEDFKDSGTVAVTRVKHPDDL